ncbi:MAG: transcription termination factor Rho, partial [Oscillospiraceae bacterium]|nr:transcription termination factor Rho [Oscillospiraceae bacterium]
ERMIYPAIDVPKSGTRREENLLSEEEQKAGWTLRRELSKEQNITQYVKVLQLMKVTKNNNELVNFINKQGL